MLNNSLTSPPKLATRFLNWFLKPELCEEVMGDLEEKYLMNLPRDWKERGVDKKTLRAANLNYWYQVINYLRPFAIRNDLLTQINPFFMLRHHFKIGWRSLIKNRDFSLINISGLALGMAVAILISLWIHDELSYNTYHENYNRTASLMLNLKRGDRIETRNRVPIPLAQTIREEYGSDFERVALTTLPREQIFISEEDQFFKKGFYTDAVAFDLFSLKLIKGTKDGLENPNGILLSESFAELMFGEANPIGKTLNVKDLTPALISGIYEDLPNNSFLNDIDFIGAWDWHTANNQWLLSMNNPWGYRGLNAYVQLSEHTDIDAASAKIKDVVLNHVTHDESAYSKNPQLFLHPMSKWRLHSRFEDGKYAGGYIESVRLVGIIGLFVLLLACINFMNLSTARSEQRAKEIGVRKTIGSTKKQLVSQFFCEAVIMALFAFACALFIIQLMLPWFNGIADKELVLQFEHPIFWLSAIGFTICTGLIAGLYPSLYLSSFKPIKALKGIVNHERRTITPRKALVVFQFSVSTILIIATIIVYQQIQFGQNRSIGYDSNNLLSILIKSGNLHSEYNQIKESLKRDLVVSEMSRSNSPITSVWGTNGDIFWEGKDVKWSADYPNVGVSHDYGKTVGWQFVAGRDFSKTMAPDSSAFIVNETAVKMMGLENPIGQTIDWGYNQYMIIGVIKDIVVESPFQSIRPSFYHVAKRHGNILNLKLNPKLSANDAVAAVHASIKEHAPNVIFDTQFVDEVYNEKFKESKRIGNIASGFALLAVLISCLGLFGLTAYMTARRTKEIGIRKVLGASVLNLWQLLSKEFVGLIVIASLIAIPIAYYFINDWLASFDYRVEMPIGMGLWNCFFSHAVYQLFDH